MEMASGNGKPDAPLTTTGFSPAVGMTAATRAATAGGVELPVAVWACWPRSLACRPLAASFASRSSSRALRRASFASTGDVTTTATRSCCGAAIRAAAVGSTGRKVSGSITCASPVPFAGNVPKWTARARAAGPKSASRCMKLSIDAEVPAGATMRTIFSAPGLSPFIARTKARARQAAWSFRRTRGSSRASAASLSPDIPSESA